MPTIAGYDIKIAEVQKALVSYNGVLAQADAAGNNFRAMEKELRVLSGVKVNLERDGN